MKKNVALQSNFYECALCKNQISMVHKWTATFFFQETACVNSKFYDEQRSWMQESSLTWMPSDSLCTQERLCSRDSICIQRWPSQDSDWQRHETMSSSLTLRYAQCLFHSRGIGLRSNQEKGVLQNLRGKQRGLCGTMWKNLSKGSTSHARWICHRRGWNFQEFKKTQEAVVVNDQVALTLWAKIEAELRSAQEATAEAKNSGISNVLVMFVSTIHWLHLLPMMLVSHCFDVFVPHIPSALMEFCCNQSCCGCIAMLISLVLHRTAVGDSTSVSFAGGVCPMISLGKVSSTPARTDLKWF